MEIANKYEEDFSVKIAKLGELVDNVLNSSNMAMNDHVDPNMVELHTTIINDDAHGLQDVCESGINLNQKFDMEIDAQHAGMTPLALASALNKADLCQVLLDHHADVNSVFATLDTTALMTASFHGHLDVVRLLLEYGADVKMCDLQQSTALGYAFGGTRNLDVIQLLLNAGIDVNQKNMLGMNSLLLVAGYGNDMLVRMILEAGADPNATNDFGHSALHLAVVGKKDQIKKLKKLGSPEAAAADRSLNRRNLDLAMQEWARLHKEAVGNSRDNEAALAKVGNFMMSIGQNLEGEDGDEDDDQAMKHRVDAVWKHRQEKMKESKEKKRPAIMNLLSCGGGKSKQASKKSAGAKPYVPAPSEAEPGRHKNDEVSQLSDRCAHILRMLLDSGCEIDKTEKTFGMTALDMAILNGDVESSAILVSSGGDADHLMKMFALTDLYGAITMAQKRDLKELLLYDVDLDVNQPFSRFNITRKNQNDPEDKEEMGDEGLTPMAVAVKTNDMDIIKMLLKHGADINGMGPGGRSPLCVAITKGNLKMVQFLMANNVDIEQPNPAFQEATPVTVATITRQQRIAEVLIKKGAKVDKEMTDGRTALVSAMDNRDEQMIDMILCANTANNFEHQGGFEHQMAEKYQKPDRDVEGILSAISEHCNHFAIADQEKAAREAQIHDPATPARGGQPQQPGRPAPGYIPPNQPQQGPRPIQQPQVRVAKPKPAVVPPEAVVQEPPPKQIVVQSQPYQQPAPQQPAYQQSQYPPQQYQPNYQQQQYQEQQYPEQQYPEQQEFEQQQYYEHPHRYQPHGFEDADSDFHPQEQSFDGPPMPSHPPPALHSTPAPAVQVIQHPVVTQSPAPAGPQVIVERVQAPPAPVQAPPPEEESETETETETESEEEEEAPVQQPQIQPQVVQQAPVVVQQAPVVIQQAPVRHVTPQQPYQQPRQPAQQVVTRVIQQPAQVAPQVTMVMQQPPEDAPPPVPTSQPPPSESGSDSGSSYSETDSEEEESPDGPPGQQTTTQVTVQRSAPQSSTNEERTVLREVLPDGTVQERTIVTRKTVTQQQVVTSAHTNNIQVVNIAETDEIDDEEETSSEEETDEDDNANSPLAAQQAYTPAKQDINRNISPPQQGATLNTSSVETEI